MLPLPPLLLLLLILLMSVTAPTDPDIYSRSGRMEFYSRAPASPRRKPGNATTSHEEHKAIDVHKSHFDSFLFEISKRYTGLLHFEKSLNFGRGDSFTPTAFADELLLKGRARPLKPPPGLQCDSDFNSFSHKSPVTMCKNPFARKTVWKDDFDPFMVALQKVRADKRGKNGLLRRSWSYSPVRFMSNCSIDTDFFTQDLHKGYRPMKQMQVPKAGYSGPLEFKRTRERALRLGGFQFGPREMVKNKQDGADKPGSAKGKYVKENFRNVTGESKAQKLKAIVLRYVSLERCKQTKIVSGVKKLSDFSRLSFKSKGNAHASGKRIPADTKMAVANKPSPGS